MQTFTACAFAKHHYPKQHLKVGCSSFSKWAETQANRRYTWNHYGTFQLLRLAHKWLLIECSSPRHQDEHIMLLNTFG